MFVVWRYCFLIGVLVFCVLLSLLDVLFAGVFVLDCSYGVCLLGFICLGCFVDCCLIWWFAT